MTFSPMPTSLEEAKKEILMWRERHRAAQPDTGLQTAIRLVLDATPEQIPMAIESLRDHAANGEAGE
jgi:hypothetical protein